MGMNRAEKEQEINEVRASLEASEMVIITQNKGLTAKQSTTLRSTLRNEKCTFKVVKNTLARRALAGTKFEGLTDLMSGPTGMAFSDDPMAAARVTYNFAKENDKLVIVGGMMGADVLDAAGVKTIALLPSLDQLRGKIIGILQAPGAQLARLANAYATKDGAGAGEATPS